MPTITFRAAIIRFVDLRYDDKSKSLYSKINFTAAYSKPVRDEMQWAELPESMPQADLTGKFSATEFTIVPNGLDASTFTLEINDMSGFSVHRVVSKEDKEKTEEELRFQIVSPQEGAASKLAKYLKIVGHWPAQLRVKYNAQSVMENQAADGQQGTLGEDAGAKGPELVDQGKGAGAGRTKERGAKIN